jgi:hypothetical protein
VTWRKGEPWARRVREACTENPELVGAARRSESGAVRALREIVCPEERLEQIKKASMRTFARRDAYWMLNEYLGTSAIELLGGLTDGS